MLSAAAESNPNKRYITSGTCITNENQKWLHDWMENVHSLLCSWPGWLQRRYKIRLLNWFIHNQGWYCLGGGVQLQRTLSARKWDHHSRVQAAATPTTRHVCVYDSLQSSVMRCAIKLPPAQSVRAVCTAEDHGTSTEYKYRSTNDHKLTTA